VKHVLTGQRRWICCPNHRSCLVLRQVRENVNNKDVIDSRTILKPIIFVYLLSLERDLGLETTRTASGDALKNAFSAIEPNLVLLVKQYREERVGALIHTLSNAIKSSKRIQILRQDDVADLVNSFRRQQTTELLKSNDRETELVVFCELYLTAWVNVMLHGCLNNLSLHQAYWDMAVITIV